MTFPSVFPRENIANKRMSYRLSLFLCYYAATTMGFFVAISAGCSGAAFVAVVLSGFGIDIVRRCVAPELKLGPEERRNHLQRSLYDDAYFRSCNKRASSMSGPVYYLWIIYLILVLSFPTIRDFSIFDGSKVAHSLIVFASMLCPYLGDWQGLLAAYGTQERVLIVVHFMSVTWWLMIIAAISEICGGAFYSLSKGFRNSQKRQSDRNIKGTMNGGLPRLLIVFLIACAFCYFIVGISQFWAFGIIGTGENKGEPVSIYNFMLTVAMVGAGLLSTATFVKILYSMALYKISGLVGPDGRNTL